MPQSLAKVGLHVVFLTKQRTPWLKDRAIRDQLYAYMATILRQNVDSPAILINGTEDHVHILCLLSRKFAIMKLVEESKKETSKWLKKQHSNLRDFSWQGGYGAFSVSMSNIPEVTQYIENQEEHHKRISFQDEFRLLCKRHDIELDEKYAWE